MRCFLGWVDYVGSSHQWWHALVVLALYYWHNTGMLYVEYRMNHGCPSSMTLWHTDSDDQPTGMRDNGRNSTPVMTDGDIDTVNHITFSQCQVWPLVVPKNIQDTSSIMPHSKNINSKTFTIKKKTKIKNIMCIYIQENVLKHNFMTNYDLCDMKTIESLRRI